MFWETPLLEAVHLIAAVLWIGGMFFAYVCLRPATTLLAPAQRLSLWHGVLRRFLGVVWAIVILLPLSGYRLASINFGGITNAPLYVQFMHVVGWLMIALFIYLWFNPRRHLAIAAAHEDGAAGATALARIRWLVAVNLWLGLAILVVVSIGGFFGF